VIAFEVLDHVEVDRRAAIGGVCSSSSETFFRRYRFPRMNEVFCDEFPEDVVLAVGVEDAVREFTVDEVYRLFEIIV